MYVACFAYHSSTLTQTQSHSELTVNQAYREHDTSQPQIKKWFGNVGKQQQQMETEQKELAIQNTRKTYAKSKWQMTSTWRSRGAQIDCSPESPHISAALCMYVCESWISQMNDRRWHWQSGNAVFSFCYCLCFGCTCNTRQLLVSPRENLAGNVKR